MTHGQTWLSKCAPQSYRDKAGGPYRRVSTGSRSVTIPDQVVGADGGISVPFAGRVPVAGRSTVDVQHEIEQRLAQKAIEPQVIVTITKSVTYGCDSLR